MRRTQKLFKEDAMLKADHLNKEGFPSFTRPLREQFVQTLLTNTVSNTFYVSERKLLTQSFDIHKKMLAEDPEFFATKVVEARNDGCMRLQPILGLVYLSTLEDKKLFIDAFGDVIRTPNDLQNFIDICRGKTIRNGLGSAVKKTIQYWLNHRLSPYWTLKYRQPIIDAVRTVRPSEKRMDDIPNDMINYLLKEKYKVKDKQIKSFEKFIKAKTEEKKIKYITEGRLPHEVVTGGTKMTPALWKHMIPNLPYFALLRNLNTLHRNKVLMGADAQYVADTLSDPERIKKSMVLPFRYSTAYKKLESGIDNRISDALMKALDESFINMPEIKGRTMISIDVSGSMTGRPLEIASLFGAALFKKSDALITAFDTSLHHPRISKMDSMMTNASKLEEYGGGGTDMDLPMDYMVKNKIFVDNFIGVTDSEEWAGRGFLNALHEYKKKVNPNVKCVLIQVQPYDDAVAPETEENVYYVYGWNDTVLDYCSIILNETFKTKVSSKDKNRDKYENGKNNKGGS